MADGLAHPADLALAALVDRELEHVRADAADARGRGHPVLEPDPGPEPAESRITHGTAVDASPVGLLHLEARMGEPVCEVAVVGEQDQAGRVDVEPADRIQARGRANERDDRWSAVEGPMPSRRRRAAC